MALIKCKKCGKEISDKTTLCVHCGAPTRSSGTNDKKILKWMKKHIIPLSVIIVLLVTIIIVKTFFISFVRVSGFSMEPTLKDGEIKIVNKVGKIERFDIVVFTDENHNTLIGRVYGLPSETISFDYGSIYIGSKRIVEDKYANGSTFGQKDVTLKSDEYYVLGDNRDISRDSRYFGAVKKSSIKGKLYGGNDKKIEMYEEISKTMDINCESKNQYLVDTKYDFNVISSISDVLVRGKKEDIERIDVIEVSVDFKNVDNFFVGNNYIYDLPLIVYDKDRNIINGIDMVPSKVDVDIFLTVKE